MKSIWLTICMGLLVSFFLITKTEAGLLFSDQLSTQMPNVWSYHIITWKIDDANGIIAGENFKLVFDSSFNLTNIDNSYIEIFSNGTNRNIVGTCGAGDEIQVNVVSNEINFMLCPNATAINQNEQIEIQIGDSVDNSHQVKNPSLPGGYYIDLTGESGYTDNGRSEVLITAGNSTSLNIAPLTGSLVLSGKTSPGAIIYIYENNSLIGTGNANNSGDFAKTVNSMSLGLHNIGIWCRDIDNNNSESLSYQFNINQLQDTLISGIMFPPTSSDKENQIKRSAPLWLSGRTFSYGKISVAITSFKDNFNLDTESDANGLYNININPKLHLGSKNYSEITYDGYGSTSESTKIKSFEVTRTSDINNDGIVDNKDLDIFKIDYKANNYKEILSDINDDNNCNLSDLSIMMYDWSN